MANPLHLLFEKALPVCDWLSSAAHHYCISTVDDLANAGVSLLLTKILISLFVLYVLLWLLAHVTGIKKRITWPKDIPYWSDNNSGQYIRVLPVHKSPLVRRNVILPYKAVPEAYRDGLHNRDAYIRFIWYPPTGQPIIAYNDHFRIFLSQWLDPQES